MTVDFGWYACTGRTVSLIMIIYWASLTFWEGLGSAHELLLRATATCAAIGIAS